MYIPKRYGQGKVDRCPFCEKQAVTQNEQKVPVCMAHNKMVLPLMKCVCGETLDMLHGKYGVFFSCIKHGNVNLRKALEINPPLTTITSTMSMTSLPASSSPPTRKMYANSPEDEKKTKERKETMVTSDELEWMD